MAQSAPFTKPHLLLTGIECSCCKQPVAVVHNIVGGRILILSCPACGNRWTSDSPETKPR